MEKAEKAFLHALLNCILDMYVEPYILASVKFLDIGSNVSILRISIGILCNERLIAVSHDELIT